ALHVGGVVALGIDLARAVQVLEALLARSSRGPRRSRAGTHRPMPGREFPPRRPGPEGFPFIPVTPEAVVLRTGRDENALVHRNAWRPHRNRWGAGLETDRRG